VTATSELDHLPVAVLHVGADGTILRANRPAAALVGRPVDQVVGRNVLEFDADAETGRGMAHLAFGIEVDETMGPVPVAYHHADGTVRHGDLWAENHLADPDVGAFVVVLLPEASAPSIASAQSSVAEGAPVDDTLELLATSLAANPFCSTGCWLVHDEGGRRLVGAGSLPEPVQVALTTQGVWWSALRDGLVEVPDVSAETDEPHRLLLAAGVRGWWLLPVNRGITGAVDAGIMVLRRRTGTISPNQTDHLQRIVTTAGLAFERAAMQARLTHAAFHDALTGVGNRERFFERPTSDLRPGTALLYVDLDDFKPVNDAHGHSTGDLVLVTVADRLRRAVRPSDRITRMGGDEFVVECDGTADDEEAIGIAERIIAAVQRPIQLDGVTIEIGASVGIARTTARRSVEALLEQSDAALYAAKAAGRGRWHLADPQRPVRGAARRGP
jgi:diguanylate cyclase (GGDEF)-like protein